MTSDATVNNSHIVLIMEMWQS